MYSNRFNPATLIILLFIVLTGVLRVFINFNLDNGRISEMALYSPLGAMALFGGAYFNKGWKAFLFPLGTLFLSDFILHQTVFKPYSSGILYSGWYWVYGAFVLMVLVGRLLLKKVTVGGFFAAVIATTFIHWIVTDIPVWMGSKIYAQNFGGFIDCLTAAIPFEWRFLISTFVYGAVLFGGYAWMQSRYTLLRVQNNSN